MGRIQQAVNNLIFQTSLIKSFSEEKLKNEEKNSNQNLKENNDSSKALNEQKNKNQTEFASKKATARANEEIQAKYMQKNNFKDRHAQAIQRRKNLTEPHKPLPKKEE